jgi:hypothetical protein
MRGFRSGMASLSNRGTGGDRRNKVSGVRPRRPSPQQAAASSGRRARSVSPAPHAA